MPYSKGLYLFNLIIETEKIKFPQIRAQAQLYVTQTTEPAGSERGPRGRHRGPRGAPGRPLRADTRRGAQGPGAHVWAALCGLWLENGVPCSAFERTTRRSTARVPQLRGDTGGPASTVCGARVPWPHSGLPQPPPGRCDPDPLGEAPRFRPGPRTAPSPRDSLPRALPGLFPPPQPAFPVPSPYFKPRRPLVNVDSLKRLPPACDATAEAQPHARGAGTPLASLSPLLPAPPSRRLFLGHGCRVPRASSGRGQHSCAPSELPT